MKFSIPQLIDAARNSVKQTSPICQAIESRLDEITWADDYCEPGYHSEKGVVFGNWNKITGWKQGEGYTQQGLDGSNIPCRLSKLLESNGFDIEWSDEWSACCDCNKAFRTSGDSYCWTPYFIWMNECELICLDCALKDESSIEQYIDDANKCVPAALVPLIEKAGFTKYNSESYENGWHPGQNNSPAKIAKELQDKGLQYIFTHDENSQFYIKFSVWTRKTESTSELVRVKREEYNE